MIAIALSHSKEKQARGLVHNHPETWSWVVSIRVCGIRVVPGTEVVL